MLERTDVITDEVLEPVTFVLAHPIVLENDFNILIYYVLLVLLQLNIPSRLLPGFDSHDSNILKVRSQLPEKNIILTGCI